MKKPHKQKIVLYGLFGHKNWGNEGTLKAALLNIDRLTDNMDVEVVCACSNPQDVSERYGISSFPIQCPPVRFLRGRNSIMNKIIRRIFLRIPAEIIHWLKVVKRLSGSNTVIAPGTGLLNDYATSAFGRPFDIFMWSLLSKLCGCKLSFVSVGAGPIKSKTSGLFIRLSMLMSDYRSFRDEYSRNYIQNLGFNSKIDPIYPDLAFSLPASMFPVREKGSINIKMIGLGLKDYYGEEGIRDHGKKVYADYLHKMSDFITWLIENGYKVRLLVGDSLYDEPVKLDLFDLLANRGIDLEDGTILFDPVGRLEELISQISNVDLLISPRLHNIIYGIMLDKPVISLSYHHKFASIMNDLGLSEYCQNLDQLNIDMLIGQFKKLVGNREEIMAGVAIKREQYRAKTEEQYSLIISGNQK